MAFLFWLLLLRHGVGLGVVTKAFYVPFFSNCESAAINSTVKVTFLPSQQVGAKLMTAARAMFGSVVLL